MNYKQTLVTGESWQKFNGVVITNDTDVHPRIRATKQQIYNTTHGVHVVPAGSLDFPYEPDFTFDVVNTETGDVLRQSNMAELYQLIYCCLMAKDQQEIALREAGENYQEPEHSGGEGEPIQ